MITRYSRKEAADIWELDNKFSYYLEVELAVIKAQVELGNFKPEVYENIKKSAKFDVKRIDEIEKITRHDVIAFWKMLMKMSDVNFLLISTRALLAPML